MRNIVLPQKRLTKYFWGFFIAKNFSIARFCDVHTMGLPKIINKCLQIMQTLKPKFLWLINPLKLKLAEGSLYCSLPNYAVDFILSSPTTEYMCKKLKYSMVGEEIFFQTILLNSPYEDKIINSAYRFYKWDGGRSPKLLDENDFEEIKTSGCFFCRKVDSKVSAKLLDMIDEELL